MPKLLSPEKPLEKHERKFLYESSPCQGCDNLTILIKEEPTPSQTCCPTSLEYIYCIFKSILEEKPTPCETCCPAFFANFRDMFTSLGFCGNKPL